MVKIIKPITIQRALGLENLLFAKDLHLEQLAWEVLFYTKEPKKITATSLFYSFFKMQSLGKNSLEDWAAILGEFIDETVHKQSLNERFTSKSVELGKSALKQALNLKVNNSTLRREKESVSNLSLNFNRILLRDSTVVNLPSHLHKDFPGSHSRNKNKPAASARVQALFDFSNEKWVDFQIGSYRDNDQGAANCIADFLEPNDLILQDLGYFTLQWIKQVIKEQFIITKWHPNCHLLAVTGEKIDLLALAKKKSYIDMPVLVGSKDKIPMRLVLRKLPQKKAAKIVAEAKKDRHAKANHSEEYMALLNYEIYLTNVKKDVLSSSEIAKLYGLRWYVEILFKSWKSYANFAKVFDKKKIKLERVKCTLYLMLTEFVWLTTIVYHEVKQKIKSVTDKHLSILKYMKIVNNFIDKLFKIRFLDQINPLIKQFAAHATHSPHSKRTNTMDKYLYIKELCSRKT
jgi:hypothetical protein